MFTCELSFIRRLAFAKLKSILRPGRVLISLGPLPNFSHLAFPHVITLLDDNAMLNPNLFSQYFNWLRSVKILCLTHSIYVWVEIVLILFTVTMKFIANYKDKKYYNILFRLPFCNLYKENGIMCGLIIVRNLLSELALI